MALQQVSRSVQNDANFSEIDLQDLTLGGPLLRIEMFRASQPPGPFGVTAAGTSVEHQAGIDHLTSASNQVFRNNFSVSESDGQWIKIELREGFTEKGAAETRVRDLDPSSATFGHVACATALPLANNKYRVRYEVLRPGYAVKPSRIPSPLTETVAALTGLPDLGAPLQALGTPDTRLTGNPLEGELDWMAAKVDINAFFSPLELSIQQSKEYTQFVSNFVLLERMGNFRDKTIHPGINLIGSNIQRASEAICARDYRSTLILLGRIFDKDMTFEARSGQKLFGSSNPLMYDPKHGVYSVFLQAYILNDQIYQLGLDKVHSDYGGVPMKLKPGSRLENGRTPIADATRFNRTLTELAFAYYVRPDFPGMRVLRMNNVI